MNVQQVLAVAILVAIGGYIALNHLDSRTQDNYVAACAVQQANSLNIQHLQDANKVDELADLTGSYCKCLAATFAQRNGKFRTALVSTGLLGTSDYTKPSEEDQIRCGAQNLVNAASGSS